MQDSNDEIAKIVNSAAERVSQGYRNRWYRRVSWGITADRLEKSFHELEQKAKNSFPNLYVYRNDEQRTIQLSCGWHRVNANKDEMESGAAMVVSQSVLGGVIVVLYPFESTNVNRIKPRIIWGIFDGPQGLNPTKVHQMMRDFLLYTTVSSALISSTWKNQKRVERLEARSRRIEGGIGPFWQQPATVAILAMGSVLTMSIYMAWIWLDDKGSWLEPWAGLAALITGWVAYYSTRLRTAVEKVEAKEEADRAERAFKRQKEKNQHAN